MKLTRFVVQARFTAQDAQHARYVPKDGTVYLDDDGNWSNLVRAYRHESRADAQDALEATWAKLRMRSIRHVILKVVEVQDEYGAHGPHAGGSRNPGDQHV